MNYSRTGTGRPVVFQHGLGANISQTTKLLSGLDGIEIFSADMRGHGETPYEADRPPTFDSYSDDLIRFLDSLGIQKAVFGGISMGAGISTNCALRYPEKVEALVLVRPAWLFDSDPANLLPLLDAAMFCNEKDGADLFSASPEIRQIRDSIPGAYDSLLGLFYRDQPEFTSEVLQRMVGDYPADENAPIRKPTLILGNDDDPLHPWEMAEAWHQHIQGSKLVKVPSRYIDPEGHRTVVRQEISQFIDTLN